MRTVAFHRTSHLRALSILLFILVPSIIVPSAGSLVAAGPPGEERAGEKAPPGGAPDPGGRSAVDGPPGGAPAAPPRKPPPAGSGSPAAQAAAPRTAEEALALWRRDRLSALPLLSRFFEAVDWKAGSVQSSFELLREVAGEAPWEEPHSGHLLPALRAFLLLGESQKVSLPGESFRAPCGVMLRLCLGLRPSSEVGPLLREAAVEELERLASLETTAGGAQAGGAPIPDRLRNAVNGIAYLRYFPGRVEVELFAEAGGGQFRLMAMDFLGELGDPSAAPLLQKALRATRDQREAAAAAISLKAVLGDAAEPHLLELSRRELPLARGAALPLLEISSRSALAGVMDLYGRVDDKRFRLQLDSQLQEYAQALGLKLEELKKLVTESPEEASKKMFPLAHRLELLGAEDQRLSREEMLQVLEVWRKKGTLYSEEWSWVRDRHILAVAVQEDLPRLEAVRAAILRVYRTTCVNEASIIQRMAAALQRARRPAKTG